MSTESDISLDKLGHDILGPITASFLLRVLSTCQYFADSRQAKILFAARAGVRIRHALDVYCGRIGFDLPDDWEIFWVSRLMAAKGVFDTAPDESFDTFEAEFKNTPWRLAQDCLLGKEGVASIPSEKFYVRKNRKPIHRMLRSKDRRVSQLRAHLLEQSGLFRSEVERLMGKRDVALLIDTGWAATTQRMLMGGMPEIEWWGAYFGLYAIGGGRPAHWSRAMGLVFEEDDVDFNRPETATIEHRHIIEHLFEPNAPSIERYERDHSGKVVAPAAAANLAAMDGDRGNDPVFDAVLRYLAEGAPKDPAKIEAEAARAWAALSRIILTPSREWAECLGQMERSADFGRRYKVPVLLDATHEKDPLERIRKSLWQSGQIALEYEPGMSGSIQRKRFGIPFGKTPAPKRHALPSSGAASVAVITRTMDRPMLLRRALASVHGQTWRGYTHVVVCDGGDIDVVRETIREANIDHTKVVLVDAVENRGMEAASNLGIGAVTSDYIIIHDDDDTWEPDFLKETVGFLEGRKGRIYGGVVTHSTYVSESVHPDGIVIEGTRGYNSGLATIALHELTFRNQFPPISFLFRREIYDRIGGFEEAYPVLGDWDFNLRFLNVADIAVIPKALANYHHRDVGQTDFFGNSVIAGIDKHIEYNALVRNAYLRSSEDGLRTLGPLVGTGAQLDIIRSRILKRW
jgi:glycosyltransferase involved in cell wall biosynthesis